MGKNYKRIVTLKSGENIVIKNDVIECPICLNGRANYIKDAKLDNSDEECLLFECQTCGAQFKIPFVDASAMIDIPDEE